MGEPIIVQLSTEEADLLFYLAECYSIKKVPTNGLWRKEFARDLASKLDERLEDALGGE